MIDYHRLASLSRKEGPVATWLAEDSEGRKVVLKELQRARLQHWKQLELFEREVAQLRALDHPRIPAVLAHHADDERLQLVQAWVPGESLEDRIERGWHPGLDEVADIARQVLELLDYLYTRPTPIIHRDLKPSNLIRDPQGQIHLIDFGAVALALGPVGASTVVGTFGYMPPEQFTGQASTRSDLYALGMSLLHLLSGKNPGEMTGDSLQPEWERFLQLPGPWQSWFEELVQPDPAHRFPSARQALRALPAPTAFQRDAQPHQLPAQLLEGLNRFDSGDTICLAHWDPSRGSLWLRHRNSSIDAVAARFGLLLCGVMGTAIVMIAVSFAETAVAGIGLSWVPWLALKAYLLVLACGLANLSFKAAQLGFRREIHFDQRYLVMRLEGPFSISSSVSIPREQIRKVDVQPLFGMRRVRLHCAGGRIRTLCLTSNRSEAPQIQLLFQWLIDPSTPLPEPPPQTWGFGTPSLSSATDSPTLVSGLDQAGRDNQAAWESLAPDILSPDEVDSLLQEHVSAEFEAFDRALNDHTQSSPQASPEKP